MKSTKKAFLISLISTLVCVAMLIGTTFAWFTDSVTSGSNKIVAGNLDIALEYSKDGTTWSDVEGKTDLFGDVTLWEPGSTSIVYLKLTNKGTLALKYDLGIIATGGQFTNVSNESKNLKDALKFAQIASSSLISYDSREEAVAATSSVALGFADYASSNYMAANDVSYITLVVTMPTSIGNEFNYKGTAPEISLNINLVASQYSAESDSFGPYYDLFNTTKVEVYSVGEFTEAVSKVETGSTIYVKKAGLDLSVEYTGDKVITLKGEKINSLTANIPNGTVHVYNEVTTVIGTNVDLSNSAHFYNKIETLNAQAGHFVVEPGAVVTNIVATPVVEEETAKELKIEVKGAATTITAPTVVPTKSVEIKVAGTVENIEVAKADTKISVKVEETAVVAALNITDTDETAKIVLVNNGTLTNEAAVASKTQMFEDIDTNNKIIVVSTAAELVLFAEQVNAEKLNGYSVQLKNDINLNNVEWTQIEGFRKNIIFDGNNKTIYNLKISNGHNAGLFSTGTDCEIKNLTIDGAYVNGIGRVGVICGHGMCVDVINCTVKNAKVTANVTDGDDGDKAGAIVGYLSGETTAKVIGCTVENVTVQGYRDIGALVGYAAGTATITNNTVSNSKVICDRIVNYKNYTTDEEYHVNSIVGEITTDVTYSNNTEEKVVLNKIIYAGTQEEVNAALASAKTGDIVFIKNTETGLKLANASSGVTIKGDGTTKIDATIGGNIANINGVTLEGLVLNFGNTIYHGFFDSNVVFNNCTINGLLFTYGIYEFNNCTFNQTSAEYNMWAYGETHYTNCEFNSYGKFVNVYNEGVGAPVSFEGCTFNNLGNANKAAVNVKESCGSTKLNYDVTITNCKTTGAFPAASQSAEKVVFNSIVQVDDITSGTTLTKVTLDDEIIFGSEE